MSPEILIFLLRLSAIWSVLLAYHWLFLRRSAFGWQRGFLLLSIGLGLLIPSLPTWWASESLAPLRIVIKTAEAPLTAGVNLRLTPVGKVVDIPLLLGVWASISLLFWARTLVQWWELRSYASTGGRTKYRGYEVITHPGVPGPMAAFGRIYLPTGLSAALSPIALLHEARHLRARHHYDALLLTALINIFWFHPLAWLLRRQLALVHEFQADAAVTTEISVRDYGRQLLQFTMGPGPFPGLFSSNLKTRIIMLTSPKALSRPGLLVCLLFVLLLAGLSLACSEAAPVPSYPKGLSTDQGGRRLPPVLEKNLVAHLYKTLEYPTAARAAHQTARVRVWVKPNTKDNATEVRAQHFALHDNPSPAADLELVIVGYKPAGVPKEPEHKHPFGGTVTIAATGLIDDGWSSFLGEGETLPEEVTIDFVFQLEE